MKKFFLVITIAAMSALSAIAQDMPLPIDKDVRIGKLDNGITYYVRHNAKPENQAEFFIVSNVGAMQEEDNQQGLAHFMEHMSFNGTKNLPGKKLIEWCESNGIKFGENLNASTGKEVTIYRVSSAPIDRAGVLDTCLLILHDWSYFATLDGKEIDDERGVIIEELRTRNTSGWRMREKAQPFLYGDTKYAKRNVIGSIDGLKSFKHQELVDFYHRWYRTDMQAIIVVGDFDVDEVIAKIKTLFADVPAVPNPEAKAVIPLPKNTEPIYGVITDPECTGTDVSIYIKHDPTPKEMNSNVSTFAKYMLIRFMLNMANTRLSDIAQKPNAPFISAEIDDDNLSNTCDVIYASASARQGESLKALDAVYTEMEKIRRFGFTESEFEIAKADYLKNIERSYNNRNDRRNMEFVGTYIINFTKNTPMLDAEMNHQISQMLVNNLNVTAVNQMVQKQFTLENQIVLIEAPEKAGEVPTEAEVKSVVEKVRNEELEAYKDNVVKEPLIPEETILKGSPVVKEGTDKFGSTVWTLENGTKIVVKKTDFKAEELLFESYAYGGISNISDINDYNTAKMIGSVISQSGVGKFSVTDLRKQLAGKSASISPSISNYGLGMEGSCSPKDVETMLQLLYLYFTSPRWSQDDYNIIIDKYRTMLKNIEANPMYSFQKESQKTAYNNNPRRTVTTTADLDKIEFAKMPEMYKNLYQNGANFTYFFVGNIEPATLKPLVEKYIGSLPVNDVRSARKDDGVRMVDGVVDNFFETKMETPKESILYLMHGKLDYSLENSLTMNFLSQILRTRYTAVIREEKGATYGVGVRGSTSYYPEQHYTLTIQFDTEKAKVDSLNLFNDVTNEIKKIADNGPSAEDLSKVKEFMLKQRKDDLKDNSTWLNNLEPWHMRGFDGISDYDRLLDEMDGAKIQKLAAKIIADNNVIRVVMDADAESYAAYKQKQDAEKAK